MTQPANTSSKLRMMTDPAVRAVAVAGLLLAGGMLLVRLADVLLMAFGAILVGVLLHAVAGPLARRGLPRQIALTLAVVLIGAFAAAMLWVFGRQAEAQLASLSEILPRAWDDLHLRFSGSPLGGVILRELDGSARAGGWLLGLGPRLAADAARGLVGALIVTFAGLYLAYHPKSYLDGALLLLPRGARETAAELLVACYAALPRWLVGQLFSMLLVGVTTGAGLALAGVPSALALGMIAGLGQFVPVVGPMAAAVPGLLAALAVGPETLAWAALVYLGAAQIEANLVTPLVLRQMAELPMAVTLFAVLAMGVLLGPLGVVFATPLAVVLYVMVRRLYVEGLLGERRPPPAGGGAADGSRRPPARPRGGQGDPHQGRPRRSEG